MKETDLPKKYIGRNGAYVELHYQGGRKKWSWLYRFIPSRLWFEGGKSKFEALVKASWHQGRSMKDMDWTPEKDRK